MPHLYVLIPGTENKYAKRDSKVGREIIDGTYVEKLKGGGEVITGFIEALKKHLPDYEDESFNETIKNVIDDMSESLTPSIKKTIPIKWGGKFDDENPYPDAPKAVRSLYSFFRPYEKKDECKWKWSEIVEKHKELENIKDTTSDEYLAMLSNPEIIIYNECSAKRLEDLTRHENEMKDFMTKYPDYVPRMNNGKIKDSRPKKIAAFNLYYAVEIAKVRDDTKKGDERKAENKLLAAEIRKRWNMEKSKNTDIYVKYETEAKITNEDFPERSQRWFESPNKVWTAEEELKSRHPEIYMFNYATGKFCEVKKIKIKGVSKLSTRVVSSKAGTPQIISAQTVASVIQEDEEEEETIKDTEDTEDAEDDDNDDEAAVTAVTENDSDEDNATDINAEDEKEYSFIDN